MLPASSDTMSSPSPSSLVIIGAGAASVKLAHTLLQSTPTTCRSITILEATSRIGGRIRSMQFEDHTVELGANWISGLENTYQNPVWDLAKSAELKGHRSARDDAASLFAVNSNGRDVTRDYLAAVHRFDTAYEKAIELVSERKLSPENDTDVKSILAECGWDTTANAATSLEKAAEYNTLEVWVSDGLDGLSAAHDLRADANDVDLGKEEVFVEDPRGFSSVLDGMVRDIRERGGRILFDRTVESVRYHPGNVEVTAVEAATGERMKYEADAVVSTVSLGVLQSDAIQFIPPLPKWKTDALKQIGMFNFAKVYVRFETKIWPDGRDQIVFVAEDKPKGYYPLWMRYRSAPPGQNLFMCYLGGSEARRVEALTEDEIKDEVEELFRRAFGGMECDCAGSDGSRFRPAAVAVTDWSRDPRFRGSYSYFPKGAFSTVPESDLTRGLTGCDGEDGRNDCKDPITFHFAGEAFDDLYNGWVQGAYRSGERVAKLILGEL